MRETLSTGTEVEIVRRDDARMGLVVAPDIFGLRPLFDAHVARWANDWQMSVVAVEPFPGRTFGADVGERVAVLPELDDDRQLADQVAAADLLGVDAVGFMGFCMGGMYAFKAVRSDRFARIVSFYGMITMPTAWRGPAQREPLECLLTGNAESVLAIIGDADPYTPPADVDQLRSTGAEVVVYRGAEHGFAHDDTRPAHRVEDAADAFARARDWLLGAAR